MEKLAPYRKPVPFFSTNWRTLSRSPYQPVVPTTMFFPARTQASIFSRTACGTVKSITASISRSFSVVSAVAPGLSAAHSNVMSWPRSRPTSATSEPVLPRPKMSSFTNRFLEIALRLGTNCVVEWNARCRNLGNTTKATQLSSIQPTRNGVSFLGCCNESTRRTARFFAISRLVVAHRSDKHFRGYYTPQ